MAEDDDEDFDNVTASVNDLRYYRPKASVDHSEYSELRAIVRRIELRNNDDRRIRGVENGQTATPVTSWPLLNGDGW